MFKKVFVLNLFFVFGLFRCDYFDEEKYEMGLEDKIAMESFEDPVLDDIAVYPALPQLNRWIKYYMKTFKIDTMLTNSGQSDSFAIDSLYNFYYGRSFVIVDTVSFKITKGIRTWVCQIDTVWEYRDTVQSKETELAYKKDIVFKQGFGFDVVLSSYANSKVDTFLTQNVDSVLVMNETYSAIQHAGESITQTLVTSQISTISNPNSYYILFQSRKQANTYFYFNDYVNIKLYELEGDQIKEVNCKSNRIPLETSAGYFKIANNSPTPAIKARYEYDLDIKEYLLEIITTDQTVDVKFRSLIIYEM